MRSKELNLFLVLCFLKAEIVTTQNSDPCTGYMRFRLPHQRLTTYNATTTLSDRFIQTGWYAEPEFIIPTSSPGFNHCGTRYPIYMQDNVTAIGGIQNVVACVDTSDVCEIKIPMQAQFCNNKLIAYNIERPSIDNAAFCLGPYVNANTLNFSTTAIVSYVVENVNTNFRQFRFSCNFADNGQQLFYRADWYIDGVLVKTSDFSAFQDVNNTRTLTDAMLKVVGITSLGFDIYCEIRASYNIGGPVSLPSKSNPVFMGIKVLTPEITVPEGQSSVIQIRSTAEIGCQFGSCSLSVTADIPEASADNQCALTVRADGACGVNLFSNRWNDTYTIKITGVITQQYGHGAATMKIILRSSDNYISQPIWANQILQPVTIHVTKDTTSIQNNKCIVQLDPYLIRFHRYPRFLSIGIESTYILYREQHTEVQFQTVACGASSGNGYCVCGVVVRVGKTMFMINHCHINYWIIDYIVCGDGGTVLDVKKRDNTEYTIRLPTGVEIIINKYHSGVDHYLEINIYPTVNSIGKTTGLCGDVKGNIHNRFKLRDGTITTNQLTFLNNWRVSSLDSLFNPSNSYNFHSWNSSFHLCKCIRGFVSGIVNNIQCEVTKASKPCFEDSNYKEVHQKRCISPTRKRRSLPNAIPDITLPRRMKRDVSWKNGWTADSSREYCENLFHSSILVKICNDIIGVDVTMKIEVCIRDIQMSGSNMFSLAAVSGVGSQCLHEAQMNRTLRQPDGQHGHQSVFEMVREIICPGQCSERGSCVKGTCICNNGFIGADCAVDLNEAPLAVGVDGDGYCDIAEERCDGISVFGGTFVEHELTRCKLRSFEIHGPGSIFNMDTEYVKPVVESDGEVTCPLPTRQQKRTIPDEAVTGYRVSVSNNGEDYSEELTMVIINSECMNCNISGEDVQCSFSPNYCIANDHCYRDGDGHPLNQEFVCRGNTGDKTWERVD